MSVEYPTPLGTPVGTVLLCSDTEILNAVVLPLTTTQLPKAHGGAKHAFWAKNSGVGLGWSFDGTKFTGQKHVNKHGDEITPDPVPADSLIPIDLSGT